MVRRTYGQVKDELARIAGETGQSMNSSRIMSYVNLITEELMNEFDSFIFYDRLRFKITQGHFVLPTDYERIAMITVDHVPMRMQSPWFDFIGFGLDLVQAMPNPQQLEFLQYGIGVLDRDDCGAFSSIPRGQECTTRVYGLVDERVDGVRPQIRIQGYDAAGVWIRTASGNGWIDGFDVEINGDTPPFYIDSSQTISDVTAIIKPTTNGNVYLYAMPSGADPTLVGVYAPKDTTPVYRRYFIPGLPSTSTYTIIARCRRRFVPITSDNDFLIISNLPVLRSMIMAAYYLEAGDPDKYAAYKVTAIDLLKKEARAYIGLQREKPAITFGESITGQYRGQYIL